jgi:DNA-binding transcriptional LysR family regulator
MTSPGSHCDQPGRARPPSTDPRPGIPGSVPGSFPGAAPAAGGDNSGVELDWLQTFLAVVDRGGFSAAAEHIHRSQSRVSAHVAALEREVGTALIDRTRRPARVTPAGDVLAAHAREILGAVGSARSAVSAARDLDAGHLTLLTTPCLAAAFLPGPLARVAAAFPTVRFAVLEDGRRDVERRFLDEGIVLAVLPALARPVAPGLREQVLWLESLYAVVPIGHRLTQLDRALRPADLAGAPLVIAGASGDATPEAADLLARNGVTVSAVVTADSAPAVAALVDAGLGVGLLTEVAAQAAVATAPVVRLPIEGEDLVRRVAVYWYDALFGDDVGRTLHRAVLTAPPPVGVQPVKERADVD